VNQPHRIGGRYEVGEILGRGGMAEVRKGTDIRLGRTVAIKRLRTDLASDATFQARFRREAQSAASLNHPAIVSVYDTGEEMSTDGSNVAQPYIVMEHVAGRTLRDILREGRKILPERALEITSGVLDALDYSHRAGIIHRDIKPGNVMLTPAGDVKVMDFGIARAVSDASSTMTQTAAVVGTAQYLSPEQARGETVDSRSDVYSTGCLLYELLTGRPPFVGDSPVSVAYQHVREQAQPPSSLDEDLDPQLDAIVMKSLAKNVADRYPSAAAMKADIERYLAGRPVQAPAVAAAPATAFVPPEHPTQVSQVVREDEEPAERKRRGPFILLALLLLALVVAALVFGPKLFSSPPTGQSVPTIEGMTRAQAESTLRANGLQAGAITESANDSIAAGRVISQDPAAGDTVTAGSEVDFVVSTGKPQITLPDVVGQAKDDAADQLRSQGLRVVLSQRDSDDTKDQVVAMQPPAGTKVGENSKVTLFWSSGPQQVPDVVGKTEAEAKRAIEGAGFKVSSVQTTSTTEPKGTVVQQSPDQGTPLSKGSTVTIVVSAFEEPSPTPSPTPTPTPTPSAGLPSPSP
jgi:beta-lactam-binding protein with PASTA domain/tRNA A-37 threonylcarbamoyl transferase component Bud32